MKWFKMYAEFAHDPRVQIMSEIMQRRLLMYFCLEAEGKLEGATNEEIAFALRIEECDVTVTSQEFQRRGFLDENGRIKNWDKRQSTSNSSAERTRKWRERNGKTSSISTVDDVCDVTVTSPSRHGDALDKNRIDKNRIDNKKNIIKKVSREAPVKKSKTIFGKPPDVSDGVWDDFQRLRKAKGAPLTETALAGMRREADKAGWTMDAALRECCERGWQGFKAEWVLKNQAKGNGDAEHGRNSGGHGGGGNAQGSGRENALAGRNGGYGYSDRAADIIAETERIKADIDREFAPRIAAEREAAERNGAGNAHEADHRPSIPVLACPKELRRNGKQSGASGSSVLEASEGVHGRSGYGSV